MKKLMISLLLFVLIGAKAQQPDNEMYVPLELWYNSLYTNHKSTGGFGIGWDESLRDKHPYVSCIDCWVRILTYSRAFPYEAHQLSKNNINAYKKLQSKLLYSRQGCDSLIRKHIDYMTTNYDGDYRSIGLGLYASISSKGEIKYYRRCVAIPASVIEKMRHSDFSVVGSPILYIDPQDFLTGLKQYRLDSLDMAEVPYYTLFPMDITPSFDCSKAKSPAEKAICRNTELAQLDTKLMHLYQSLIKKQGEALKFQQREWIKLRDNSCDEKTNDEIIPLLIKMYSERIRDLKQKK